MPLYELNMGTRRLGRALLPKGFVPTPDALIADVPFEIAELRDAGLIVAAGNFAAAMVAYRCALLAPPSPHRQWQSALQRAVSRRKSPLIRELLYRAAAKLAPGAADWAVLDFALMYCLVSLDLRSLSTHARVLANAGASTSTAGQPPAGEAAAAAAAALDSSGPEPTLQLVERLLQRGGFALEDKASWDHAFVERDFCGDTPGFRHKCERLARVWWAAAIPC